MKPHIAVVLTAAVALGLVARAGAQKNSEADALPAAQQKEMTEPANTPAYPTFDPPAEPKAEVPSIKFDKITFRPCDGGINPNGRTIGTADSWGSHCQPIRMVIGLAYTGAGPFHLSGEPAWVDTEPYDFQAKVAPEDVPVWQKMNVATRRIMVRNMLADLLHLKVHTVTETHPMYALVVAPGGLKLNEYKDGDTSTMPNGQVVTGGNIIGGNHLVVVQGMILRSLAGLLTVRLDRDVVDKTGLTGRYSYSIQVPSDRNAEEDPEERQMLTTAAMDDLKQFGLKLEPGDMESTTVVVDHIDRPPVADQPSE